MKGFSHDIDVRLSGSIIRIIVEGQSMKVRVLLDSRRAAKFCKDWNFDIIILLSFILT